VLPGACVLHGLVAYDAGEREAAAEFNARGIELGDALERSAETVHMPGYNGLLVRVDAYEKVVAPEIEQAHEFVLDSDDATRAEAAVRALLQMPRARHAARARAAPSGCL